MNRVYVLALLPFAMLVGCAADTSSEEAAGSDESELTSDGNRSDYTAISGTKTCFNKVTDGDEAPIAETWCGGRGGYTFYTWDGDDRQAVSLPNGKNPNELRNVDAVNYAFTYLGERAEWRSTQKDPSHPFAAIFRQFVSDDPLSNKSTQMLVVSKLSGGKACIFKIINATKHADANQRAREASNAALKGVCPKTLPKPE